MAGGDGWLQHPSPMIPQTSEMSVSGTEARDSTDGAVGGGARPVRAIKKWPSTPADVADCFQAAGSKGATPDTIILEELFAWLCAHEGTARAFLKSKPRKSPLIDPFWKALRAIGRTGEDVLESLEWQRETFLPLSIKHGISLQDLDNHISDVEQLLDLSAKLQKSMVQADYGTRSELWHEVATAIARRVTEAYRAVDRKPVSLTKADAPAVAVTASIMAHWGRKVELEAVAKMFQRRKKGDNAMVEKSPTIWE
jgi:hypothetical protein